MFHIHIVAQNSSHVKSNCIFFHHFLRMTAGGFRFCSAGLVRGCFQTGNRPAAAELRLTARAFPPCRKAVMKKMQNFSAKGLTKSIPYGIISAFRSEAVRSERGRWCGSMAEQLICNQQVVGSTPITSSNESTAQWTFDKGDFPSGQRGQTVNLLSYDFGGPNPPSPTKIDNFRQKIVDFYLFVLHFSLNPEQSIFGK